MFDDFQELDEEDFGFLEPESVAGLSAPRESDFLIGHDNIEQELIQAINSDTLPHAIIFSGPVGIGKSTMAFRLARYLLKNGKTDQNQDSLFGDEAPAAEAHSLDVTTDDPIFSKVASGGHPDFISFEYSVDPKKTGKESPIDVYTARKVAPFLRMTSADSGWRVVIIDNADTMNRNAQNALLKILEEPPEHAILILVCHRLGAMIPTIRSRCRTYNFQPLSADNLGDLMQKEIGNSLSPEDMALLNQLSGGSIGEAQKIYESDGIQTAQQVFEALKSWPKRNWIDIHHMADQVARPSQEAQYKNLERSLLWIIENFIFTKAGKQSALPESISNASMMEQKTLEGWLEIYQSLKNHFNQVEFSNLDKRQGVIGAFQILSA